MKKYFLLSLFILPLFIQAQDETLVIEGSKKSSKKLTPQQVIDSINKRFPDAKSVQYFETSPEVVNKGWSVTEEDNLGADADLQYYTIKFKQDNLMYYGLYNKNGELMKLKMEEKLTELPESVNNAIKTLGDTHPGFTITSKTYYKNQDQKNSKEYYEVIAKNGKVTRHLYYQADGTLITYK